MQIITNTDSKIEGHEALGIHETTTMDQAVNGAADKLTRLIKSTLGRLRDLIRRDDSTEAKGRYSYHSVNHRRGDYS